MNNLSPGLAAALALSVGAGLGGFIPGLDGVSEKRRKQQYLDSLNPGPPTYDVHEVQKAQAAAAKSRKKSRAERKKGK